jgi:ectoine hydroxylase-related dioxygenase (phytanoyl-CoA dioxygenase family)
MTYSLSSVEIQAFEQDGAVPLRGVVDSSQLARIAAAVDEDMRNPGPFFHGYETEEGRFHGNLRLWETNDVLREVCLRSDLPFIAQQVFGAKKINLLYDQLFVKESGMGQRTRWHNDQPYWPIRGWQVASIWIALDKTTADNGRLEFVQGSHRWERWFQPETFGKTADISPYARNPDYEDIPDIEAQRDDYNIVSWDLEPGDVYLFHAMTVHGAGGNQHQRRPRRGYTIRYVGDDVTYDGRIGVSEPLLCDTLRDGEPLDSERYPVIIN